MKKLIFSVVVFCFIERLAFCGNAFTFGYNIDGCLGDGTDNSKDKPIAVKSDKSDDVLFGKTVVAAGCGTYHTVVLTTDGKLFSFGSNDDGKLGNGGGGESFVPVAVDTSGVLSGRKVALLAVGESHTIAVTEDNIICGWGSNSNGELGDGGDTYAPNAPIATDMDGVLSGKTITKVAAASSFSLALAEGKVYSWGYNSDGALGIGNNEYSVESPVAVDDSGLLNGVVVTDISASFSSVLVVTSDNEVFGWGKNSYGQLGTGNTIDSNAPVAFTDNGVFDGDEFLVKVSIGDTHALGLTNKNRLFSWGSNYCGSPPTDHCGKLGINDLDVSNSLTPVMVDDGWFSGKKVVEIYAARSHSLIITDDFKAYAWGYRGYLGDNYGTDQPCPVPVYAEGALEHRKVVAVNGQYWHSIILTGCDYVSEFEKNDYHVYVSMNPPVNLSVRAVISPHFQYANFSGLCPIFNTSALRVMIDTTYTIEPQSVSSDFITFLVGDAKLGNIEEAAAGTSWALSFSYSITNDVSFISSAIKIHEFPTVSSVYPFTWRIHLYNLLVRGTYFSNDISIQCVLKTGYERTLDIQSNTEAKCPAPAGIANSGDTLQLILIISGNRISTGRNVTIYDFIPSTLLRQFVFSGNSDPIPVSMTEFPASIRNVTYCRYLSVRGGVEEQVYKAEYTSTQVLCPFPPLRFSFETFLYLTPDSTSFSKVSSSLYIIASPGIISFLPTGVAAGNGVSLKDVDFTVELSNAFDVNLDGMFCEFTNYSADGDNSDSESIRTTANCTQKETVGVQVVCKSILCSVPNFVPESGRMNLKIFFDGIGSVPCVQKLNVYKEPIALSASPLESPLGGGISVSIKIHSQMFVYSEDFYCIFGDLASVRCLLLSSTGNGTSVFSCVTPKITYMPSSSLRIRVMPNKQQTFNTSFFLTYFGCEVGEELIESGDCNLCAQGSVSLTRGVEPCSRCPGVQYAVSSAICQPCPLGEIPIESGASCLPCAAGEFRGLNDTGCVKCPQGFSSKVGTTLCTLCQKGTYSPTNGSSSCTECSTVLYSFAATSDSTRTKCICSSGYSLRFGTCAKCPIGADCTEDGAEMETMKSIRGYWISPSINNPEIHVCKKMGCIGGERDSQCAAGYVGLLCDTCAHDYMDVGVQCQKCISPMFGIISAIVFIVVMATYCVVMSAKLSLGDEKKLVSRYLKIGLSFFQYTALSFGFPFRWDMVYISSVQQGSSTVFDPKTVVESLRCWASISFYISRVIIILVPLIIVAVAFVVIFFKYAWKDWKEKKSASITGTDIQSTPTEDNIYDDVVTPREIRVSLVVVSGFAFHPFVTKHALNMFWCSTVEDTRYISTHMAAKCGGTTYMFSALFATVLLLVYSLGFPIISTRRASKMTEPGNPNAGSLYLQLFRRFSGAAYGHIWYWEAVLLLGKGLLAVMVLSANLAMTLKEEPVSFPQMWMVGIIIVISFYAIFSWHWSPFNSSTDNNISFFGNVCTIVTIFLGTCTMDKQNSAVRNSNITIAALLVNVLFMISFVVTFLVLFIKSRKKGENSEEQNPEDDATEPFSEDEGTMESNPEEDPNEDGDTLDEEKGDNSECECTADDGAVEVDKNSVPAFEEFEKEYEPFDVGIKKDA